MFGLFTRQSRRPRKVRRTPARPALRVETLETRCNPSGGAGYGGLIFSSPYVIPPSQNGGTASGAAPILINTTAVWQDPYDVMISGTVTNSYSPTVIYVTGSTMATVVPDYNGAFSTVLKTDGSGPVNVQAVNTDGLYSGSIAFAYNPNAQVQQSNGGVPTITGVTVTLENGVWHIRGQVQNSTPIATVIQVMTSIPGQSGRPSVVENADGTFDIGITLDPNSPGGTFTIVAINNDTGAVSDQWNGSID